MAATDGAGTKVELAVACGRHRGIGVDLVAMCVNDLVVQGAEPLFFLDYFATGRLEPAVAASVLEGVAQGCRLAGCALIGGETAEMPGLYAAGHYDLAGFAVGAVERDSIITGAACAEGDVVLGLAASGLHANGFSLVRRILDHVGTDLNDPAPFDSAKALGEALMAPTRIYVGSILDGLRAGGIHALAHITGGGLLENIPRILPPSVAAEIDLTTWQPPAVFGWLAEAGGVAATEMARTFNCGVGMVAVVAADRADALSGLFAQRGEKTWAIGRLVTRDEGDPAVRLVGMEPSWPR